VTDDELDRRLRLAMQVEPSPYLAARILERVKAWPVSEVQPRWTPLLAGGLAAAVILGAVVATRGPQRPPSAPRGDQAASSIAPSTGAVAPGVAISRPPIATNAEASGPWRSGAPRRLASVRSQHLFRPAGGDAAVLPLELIRPATAAEPAEGTAEPERLSIPALDITPLDIVPLEVVPLVVTPLVLVDQIAEGGQQ
jgi:hypothetical protein